MSKHRKESEESLKGKGRKTPSLREPCPLEAPYWIDNDLQVPYSASPSPRPLPEDLLVDEEDGDDQVPYFGRKETYRPGESLDRNNQVPHTGQEQTYRLEDLILDLNLEPRICDILLPPSEKPSKKSKKPPPVVELRKLTPSEYESLMEDMKATGRQAKGRFYIEDGKVRFRPKKD